MVPDARTFDHRVLNLVIKSGKETKHRMRHWRKLRHAGKKVASKRADEIRLAACEFCRRPNAIDDLSVNLTTPPTLFGFDTEAVDHVAANMGEQQIRRPPAVDRGRRLVGVIFAG